MIEFHFYENHLTWCEGRGDNCFIQEGEAFPYITDEWTNDNASTLTDELYNKFMWIYRITRAKKVKVEIFYRGLGFYLASIEGHRGDEPLLICKAALLALIEYRRWEAVWADMKLDVRAIETVFRLGSIRIKHLRPMLPSDHIIGNIKYFPKPDEPYSGHEIHDIGIGQNIYDVSVSVREGRLKGWYVEVQPEPQAASEAPEKSWREQYNESLEGK